jgi:hypothetical protein
VRSGHDSSFVATRKTVRFVDLPPGVEVSNEEMRVYGISPGPPQPQSQPHVSARKEGAEAAWHPSTSSSKRPLATTDESPTPKRAALTRLSSKANGKNELKAEVKDNVTIKDEDMVDLDAQLLANEASAIVSCLPRSFADPTCQSQLERSKILTQRRRKLLTNIDLTGDSD